MSAEQLTIKALQEALLKEVKISTQDLSVDELEKLMAQTDIVIGLHSQLTRNEELVALSKGKTWLEFYDSITNPIWLMQMITNCLDDDYSPKLANLVSAICASTIVEHAGDIDCALAIIGTIEYGRLYGKNRSIKQRTADEKKLDKYRQMAFDAIPEKMEFLVCEIICSDSKESTTNPIRRSISMKEVRWYAQWGAFEAINDPEESVYQSIQGWTCLQMLENPEMTDEEATHLAEQHMTKIIKSYVSSDELLKQVRLHIQRKISPDSQLLLFND